MTKGSKRPNKRVLKEAERKPIDEQLGTLQPNQAAPPPIITTTEASGIPDIPQEQNQMTYSQKEVRSVGKSLSKLGKHFVMLLSVVALGVLMHFLLLYVFGDPKFFDLIPIRFVVDSGDIAIILTFVIIIIRELWNLEE